VIPFNDEPRAQQSKPVLTTFLLTVVILAGPLGNVLLGKGMKETGRLPVWPPKQLMGTGLKVFGSGSIWLGVASLITFFIAYMLVLSVADYSYVQPAASLAYGIAALLGHFWLGEHISALRWTGIAVICMGVVIVSRTDPQTTSPQTTERV
jgi:drug/metabolite transporter (DMT)-like permease